MGLIDDDESQPWNPCENSRPRSDDNGGPPALGPTQRSGSGRGSQAAVDNGHHPRSQRLLEVPLQSVGQCDLGNQHDGTPTPTNGFAQQT